MQRRVNRIVCFMFCLLPMLAGLSQAATWRDDFDRLCSQTEVAPSLPADKIQELIKESDRLLKTLETLNAPEKKVIVFRLKKCRNFFEYILELREEESPETDAHESSK